MSGDSCVNCLDVIYGCSVCSSDKCDECDATLFFTSIDGVCVCMDTYFCIQSNGSQCLVCSNSCTKEENKELLDGECRCLDGYF